MPRPARVTAAAWHVNCPHCGADQAEPSTGSFIWEAHQIRGDRPCFDCGKTFTLKPRR